MYFDTTGNPVNSVYSGYGCHKEYDENGRNTKITYVDEERNPTITKLGYAVRQNTFYDDGVWLGKVENEFYYDESEKPIALSNGEFGLHREYDDLGRSTELTYLDINGKPMLTNKGYTTIKRTFYPDDTVRTEMYYDMHGQPVALSQGQFGKLIENDEIIFLDEKGRKQFNIQQYLYTNHISVIMIALVIVVISLIPFRKREDILLAVFYSTFIFYITLMNRELNDSKAELEIFWSYKKIYSDQTLRIEILKNIWLFVPLGSILRKLCSLRWVLLIAISISVAIEIIQYVTGFGLAEYDDIISNVIGALIGFEYGYIIEHLIFFVKCLKADK